MMSKSVILASLLLAIGLTVVACKPAGETTAVTTTTPAAADGATTSSTTTTTTGQ